MKPRPRAIQANPIAIINEESEKKHDIKIDNLMQPVESPPPFDQTLRIESDRRMVETDIISPLSPPPDPESSMKPPSTMR